MSKAKPIDLGLKHVDELFMDDAERAELKLPRIHDIPLDQIDDFPDHPFKVREDEDIATDEVYLSNAVSGLFRFCYPKYENFYWLLTR